MNDDKISCRYLILRHSFRLVALRSSIWMPNYIMSDILAEESINTHLDCYSTTINLSSIKQRSSYFEWTDSPFHYTLPYKKCQIQEPFSSPILYTFISKSFTILNSKNHSCYKISVNSTIYNKRILHKENKIVMFPSSYWGYLQRQKVVQSRTLWSTSNRWSKNIPKAKSLVCPSWNHG